LRGPDGHRWARVKRIVVDVLGVAGAARPRRSRRTDRSARLHLLAGNERASAVRGRRGSCLSTETGPAPARSNRLELADRVSAASSDPARFEALHPGEQVGGRASCSVRHFVAARPRPRRPTSTTMRFTRCPTMTLRAPQGPQLGLKIGRFRISPAVSALPRAAPAVTSDFLASDALVRADGGSSSSRCSPWRVASAGRRKPARCCCRPSSGWRSRTIATAKGEREGMVSPCRCSRWSCSSLPLRGRGISWRFVTASKLYPGLLVVYLLVRRR